MQLLRSKVYFPLMDKLVEQALQQCIACQAASLSHQVEPLQMSQLQTVEWTDLSADFLGPLSDGSYLLVIIDEYSRFPIVEVVSSTSARAVIPIVDKVMSLLGICKTLKTDNGPPWNGSEWSSFCQYLGFKHKKITPLWPSANSLAERFMASLNKVLRTARVEGKCWKQEINAFLRVYRSTPHPTTGKTPAELLLHRTVRMTLPTFVDVSDNKTASDVNIRLRDTEAKRKMKLYADNRRHATHIGLQIGDSVLVKAAKKDKSSPFYDPKPYQVTKINGTMISATRESHTITRNASFFKKVKPKEATQASDQHQPIPSTVEQQSDESDDDDFTAHQIPVRSTPSQDQPPENRTDNTVQPRRYPQRQFRNAPHRFNDFIRSINEV